MLNFIEVHMPMTHDQLKQALKLGVVGGEEDDSEAVALLPFFIQTPFAVGDEVINLHIKCTCFSNDIVQHSGDPQPQPPPFLISLQHSTSIFRKGYGIEVLVLNCCFC
ncbi:hypothetical protein POM88_009106 [Heracleum sosnowskyi]|uniref:Uncharacterized protein n=1 Tax=Heracleum sosnowskyi TaxID=360622 RepID=A0AAD8N976_9APIA|nr:hypothetical protein POM88_009106 [Heracleum sosnowskyi]